MPRTVAKTAKSSRLARIRRHKHFWRFSLTAINVIVLAVILAVVIHSRQSAANAHLSLAAGSTPSATSAVANPLDLLSSAYIAQTVAQINNLPETAAISNQAQSQAANLAIASTSSNVVAKPQVTGDTLVSRADIQTYVTKAGDTVSGLAAKFGVTSDSIRWSNNLSANDALNPGITLTIPPVSGIVYTVKAGDTADSLAVRFHSNRDQIIAYNDAEISGLTPGEQIIIPNALPTPTNASTGFLWGSGPMYGYNGYDFGNCTWYVASQVNVPGNWGNANTWAYYARLSGWNVSSTPIAGSIAQTSAGYFGHVAVVRSVNSNGTVTISEMNFAGFDVVDTRTTSISEFQNYISR